MSRCFPYPPPYFGEAEIESIKREKERLDKDEKKERKRERKEKRKEKKEKDRLSGQEHELKELKNSLKKRKYEELGLVEPKEKSDNHQHHHKSKKRRDEQLEMSDLSEEHGQPSAGRSANFESPKGSQDSSKRRNSGSMLCTSPSLINSGTIRIKLQTKLRDPVPNTPTPKPMQMVRASHVANSREEVPAMQATKFRGPISVPQGTKVIEQVSVLQAPKPRNSPDSLLQKPRSVPRLQTMKPRESVLGAIKSKEPGLDSVAQKPRELSLPHAPKVVPRPNITGLPKPHGAWKSEAGRIPTSLVAKPSIPKEPRVNAKIEPCARTQILEEKHEAVQKQVPVTKPKQKDVIVSPAIKQISVQQPVQPVPPKLRGARVEPVESKPTAVSQQLVQALNAKHRVAEDGLPHVLKQDKRPAVLSLLPVAADEPCFSGRKTEAGEKRESKHHHQHSSKRGKRKEADKLYEELITNWKPPAIHMFHEDVDDLDWLMSGNKKRRVEDEKVENHGPSNSSSKCKAGDRLLDHINGMAESSYQPRAVYMPELNMYQLPYVMPF